jgi:hypothetical protein
MCCTKLSCLLLVVAQKSSRSTMSFSVEVLAVLAHDHRAALLAEGRIGQHHVEALAGVGRQRVGHLDGHALLGADAVQHQVHRAHARRGLHQLPAAEGAFLEVALLVAGEVGVVLHQVLVRGEQKAAGAAGRVADRLAGPRARCSPPSPGSARAA